MENKINIAELLKDCPKGMELDCIIFNNPVKYESANDNGSYPISVSTEEGELFYLNKYGCLYDRFDSKCAIFPKGKTTWEGFIPPCKFKDGDIVVAETYSGLQVFILQKAESDYEGYCYMGYDFILDEFFDAGEWVFDRLATEEEKQKLFDAIKSNGYKWNAETKTLDKLLKFKVGDKVRYKDSHNDIFTITSIEEYYYSCGIAYAFCFEDQDDYELVQNKFDITTFSPFDKVLARCSSLEKWRIQLFEKYDKTCKYPFICMGYNKYKECIPYEQNEHLLDKTDDCDDFYKTW